MPPHDNQLPERLRRRVAEDVRRISETRVAFGAHLEQLQFFLGDFRVENIDWFAIVVEGRRSKYNERCSYDTSYRE